MQIETDFFVDVRTDDHLNRSITQVDRDRAITMQPWKYVGLQLQRLCDLNERLCNADCAGVDWDPLTVTPAKWQLSKASQLAYKRVRQRMTNRGMGKERAPRRLASNHHV